MLALTCHSVIRVLNVADVGWRTVWILVMCDREENVIAIGGFLDGRVAQRIDSRENDVTAMKSRDASIISAQRTNKCRYWISFLKLSYFELLRLLIHVLCVSVCVCVWHRARQRCIRYVWYYLWWYFDFHRIAVGVGWRDGLTNARWMHMKSLCNCIGMLVGEIVSSALTPMPLWTITQRLTVTVDRNCVRLSFFDHIRWMPSTYSKIRCICGIHSVCQPRTTNTQWHIAFRCGENRKRNCLSWLIQCFFRRHKFIAYFFIRFIVANKAQQIIFLIHSKLWLDALLDE